MTTTTMPAARPATVRRAVARHGLAVTAQVVAGVGNLAFAIIAVHRLDPVGYAHLSAFLSAFLVINTPSAALTAGAALRPELASALRPTALRVGIAVALAGAVCAIWLSRAANLPASMVILLAADAPVAAVIALERGRLFGQQRVAAAAATMVVEPVARLTVGLALLAAAGAVGAAAGVVAGGYLSLLAALLLARRRTVVDLPEPPGAARTSSPATVLAFLLITLLGAADVIVANRVLAPADAGVFAAVSTLGGAVLFATATVPLVALGQLRDRVRHVLPVALALTVATAAAAGLLCLAPTRLLSVLLGHYAELGRAVLPTYLAAMGALACARVLLAWVCARAGDAAAVLVLTIGAAAQWTLLLRAHTPEQAALATLVAGAVALGGLAVLGPLAARVRARNESLEEITLKQGRQTRSIVPGTDADEELSRLDEQLAGVDAPPALHGDGPAARRRQARGARWRGVDTRWALGLAAAAAVVRLVTDRSVWIDEAISVHEAVQPYRSMLTALRTTDVHPPLYFTFLWAAVHATGSTSEMVVRVPSLVAGVLLVVVIYAAARELWDRRTARVAGLIATVGPAAVWYSQDARMYAQFMLFATVAAWMTVRVLQRGRYRDLALLVLACSAMLWSQYDTAFPVATLFLILLGAAIGRVRRRQWKLLMQTLLAGVAVIAAAAPLVPWVLQQYGHTGGLAAKLPSQASLSNQTQGVNAYSVLTNGVWAVFGYHSDRAMLLINALWPLLILGILLALGRGRSTTGAVFAAVATVPPLVLFVLAQRRTDMFDMRYFSATVPMLTLLIGRAVATWPRGRFTRTAVPALLAVGLVAGLVDEQINRSNPRVYDFRDAVAYVRTHAAPGDLLLYGPSYLTAELEYYRPGVAAAPINGTAGPAVKGHRHVFVLGSFLNIKGTAGQVGAAVGTLGHSHRLIAKRQFPNVTVWEYAS